MKTLFVALMAVAALASCNNKPAVDEDKTASDSLFKVVIDGHNVAMGKMGRLERVTKHTQTFLDSIAKLPAKTRTALAHYTAQLQQLELQLKAADSNMNTWMSSVSIDTFRNDLKARINYLSGESAKIDRIKEEINNSLAAADSLLKK